MATPIVPRKATTVVRPFIKWAGGKMQLLSQLEAYFPLSLRRGQIQRYVEPFLGSGAVFIHVIQHFRVDEAFLSDINPELIRVYSVVQRRASDLLEILEELHSQYYSFGDNERATLFYEIRSDFNHQRSDVELLPKGRGKQPTDMSVQRAAYLIFLNKTCFNGLFRVNKKGEFNVPFGRYSKPLICDPENILAVSQLLQHTELRVSTFSESREFIKDKSFVYFDPPYRPLNSTSSFTSYSISSFADPEQARLAHFFRQLHDEFEVRLMLSNADPKNVDPHDDFFEELYEGFNIYRVSANRMINSNASRRGKISELLITNYTTFDDCKL